MSVLLDTNAYSALKRGHAPLATLVRRSPELLVSSVVLGELLYGFRHGSQQERNMKELRAFLASTYVRVLSITPLTADRYSRVALALRLKGTPIPTNDIWIAAHAMETGTELVSFDAHFSHVDGLVLTKLER
ncbi:MAG: type II toxin-antitoxin system VapC family toxin [Deltaproteobacteria bacterium]|nr:type II toxin-antitoxin system VapC family toxin [Deltaproteobacteria bacterium]